MKYNVLIFHRSKLTRAVGKYLTIWHQFLGPLMTSWWPFDQVFTV